MNYKKYYSKFDNKHYTTIRKRKNGKKIDEIEPEKVKGIIIHYAKIQKIERKRLSELSTAFLCEETDGNSREDALRILQSFYKTEIIFVPYWYIFHMEKMTLEAYNELMQGINEMIKTEVS